MSIEGREAFTAKNVVRDPKVAAQARQRLGRSIEKQIREKLDMDGVLPEKAMLLSKQVAANKMATLAALHNPDLFAGEERTLLVISVIGKSTQALVPSGQAELADWMRPLITCPRVFVVPQI